MALKTRVIVTPHVNMDGSVGKKTEYFVRAKHRKHVYYSGPFTSKKAAEQMTTKIRESARSGESEG